MRPRVFPAEDRHQVGGEVGAADASMRPRVFPAEDTRTGPALAPRQSRFNEAAGIPRGRLHRSQTPLPPPGQLQ